MHRALAALLVLGAGACRAAPEPAQGDPLATARRLLNMDFGARAVADDDAQLHAIGGWFARELQRTSRLTTQTARTVPVPQRTNAASERMIRIANAEAARRPHVPARLTQPPASAVQAVVDGAVRTAPLLLSGQDPLGDPADQEHRTDPHDTRPEATLWQRLRRRLRF